MHYRMIGIDMDGTLLNETGHVSQGNKDAIKRAHDAGVLIVPCTGRAWHESIAHLRDIPDLQEGIFATGAIMQDIHSGETLKASPIESELAHELIEHMSHLPEAVLVLRDHAETGHHYYVATHGEIHELTQGWFKQTNAVVSHANEKISGQSNAGKKEDTSGQSKKLPGELPHALRVGIITSPDKASALNQLVLERYERRVTAHAFAAVQETTDGEIFDILEIFGAQVNKWEGLKLVATRHDIAPVEIAVIGDQINDLSMMAGSSCGIAMGNAVESVKASSKFQTASHQEDGVAIAIEHLLNGKWR